MDDLQVIEITSLSLGLKTLKLIDAPEWIIDYFKNEKANLLVIPNRGFILGTYLLKKGRFYILWIKGRKLIQKDSIKIFNQWLHKNNISDIGWQSDSKFKTRLYRLAEKNLDINMNVENIWVDQVQNRMPAQKSLQPQM